MNPEQDEKWHQSRQATLYGSLIFFLVIGNTSVALRLISQWKRFRRFLTDDYFAVIAVAFSDLLVANFIVATKYGLGLHISRVVAQNPYNLITLFKYTWVDSVFVGPTFLAIRLSLLFLYRRIFLVHQKWLKAFWWGNIVYNILWVIGSTGYFLFQCWPVSFYWERYYSRFNLRPPHPITGQCNVSSPTYVGVCYIFGLVADVALLVIPIAALSDLKRSWGSRLALISVFGVGLLACALELVRIVITMVGTDAAHDPTYGEVDFIILTAGTAHIGIMCACMPVVSALFKAPHQNQHGHRDTLHGHVTRNESRPTNFFYLQPKRNSAQTSSGRRESAFDRLSDEELLPNRTTISSGTPSDSLVEISAPGKIKVRTDFEWERVDRP